MPCGSRPPVYPVLAFPPSVGYPQQIATSTSCRNKMLQIGYEVGCSSPWLHLPRGLVTRLGRTPSDSRIMDPCRLDEQGFGRRELRLPTSAQLGSPTEMLHGARMLAAGVAAGSPF